MRKVGGLGRLRNVAAASAVDAKALVTNAGAWSRPEALRHDSPATEAPAANAHEPLRHGAVTSSICEYYRYCILRRCIVLTAISGHFWPEVCEPHPLQSDGPSQPRQSSKVRLCSSDSPLLPLTVSPADLIQEMYLKELKAYKIPQPKPSDSEGHVQRFQAPAPPKSPEESDLAGDMKAYEDQQVEVEGQASEGEATEPVDDYFEDLKQIDEEEHAHGGH